METDLKAARSLQRILLPRDVEVRGLEVGIRSRPAREISGDVYEFYDHSDDYTVIAFGDVSGKGAAAALYGALISGLLRTLAPRKRSPALLMQALNEALLERRVDAQYATLTVLLWEARGRTLTIVNAGGEAPLVYRHGELITLQGNGFPIGLLEARDYEEAVFEMETGDSILLYSDGIVDQLNEQEQDFGQARVREFMEKSGKQPPRAAVDSLIAQVDEYRGAMPLTDDQTAVILKVL
jgi:sigma-B regulation protein RsbU (phosphoserine phosphatase)